jgi:hypothetical protein
MSVARGVQEVALESVHGLDGERDPAAGGVARRFPVHFCAISLLRVGRSLAGELAQRLVERAAEDVRAEFGTAIDRPHQMVERPLALRGVGRDGAAARRHHGDGRARKACTFQPRAKLGVVGRVALEERDLDAVVAGRLEPIEERGVFFDDVGRPEQQVESELHRHRFPFFAHGRTKEGEFLPLRIRGADDDDALQGTPMMS